MGRKKTRFYLSLILVLAFCCIVSCSTPSSKFAAKVNGVGIKKVTLDAAINNFVENQKVTGVEVREEDKAQLRKGILEELISAELLYQESKKAEMGDVSKKVEIQLANMKKGFGSEENYKKILEDRGIAEKDLKKDMEKGLCIKAFLDKDIYTDIIITEAEKKQEYEANKDRLEVPEQIRASHILIRAAPDASDEVKDEARKKLEGLRENALSGEDFAELAKANSEDGSAARGGDLGYFGKGSMVEPFEEVAFDLEKDEISKVVETNFGYHIIKLLDRTPAHNLTYEEVEKDIEGFLLNQRRKGALDKFVNELREKAKIERF